MLQEIKREDLFERVMKFIEEKVSSLYKKDEKTHKAPTQAISQPISEDKKALLVEGLERVVDYCKTIPVCKVYTLSKSNIAIYNHYEIL